MENFITSVKFRDSGATLSITSEEFYPIETIIVVRGEHDGEPVYFKRVSAEAYDSEKILYTFEWLGYYNKPFKLDPRYFVDLSYEVVLDLDTIEKIEHESAFC